MDNLEERYRQLLPKQQHLTFDAVEFVIDKIGPDSVTGHYIFKYKGKEITTLPPLVLEQGKGALLDGVRITTRIKVKFNQ